jgi:hypothetical protein
MVGVIEKLENNELVLLMYLADELPAEDRLEVEQMLSIDPSLRAEHERLQHAQEFVHNSLRFLDDASPNLVNVDFAARQVGRELRQRLARPKARPMVAPQDQPARSWRWFYPTAAAASIAILVMLWLGRQAAPIPMPHMNSGNNTELADSQSEVNVNLLMQSLQPPADADQGDAKPITSADDDSRQVALGDAMPQDEISQYLLSAGNNGGN